MAKKTEETTENPVATTKTALPAGYDIDALVADATSSNPQLTGGDVALPYIYILQGLSPQVNAGLPSYIEGATASMFFNNVTDEVFDGRKEGLVFIPCAYERRYVEWVDRDSGGGWVADYDINSDIMSRTRTDEKKRARLPNGHLIVETAYHYGLFKDPNTGDWGQCVLPMKSTALKKNRAWNNMIVTSKIPGTDIQAPWFLFSYVLKSVIETKNENSWWNFDIQKNPEPISADLYAKAKEFAQLVNSGLISRQGERDPNVESDIPHDPETGEVLDKDGNFPRSE